MGTWKVRVAFILNRDDFDRYICGLINVCILQKVYLNLVESCDSRVESTARVNVHDNSISRACMIVGHVCKRNYLDYAHGFQFENTNGSYISAIASCPITMISLASRRGAGYQ